MIKTTPPNLWDEIQAGRKYVDSRLCKRRELIEQYHGRHWGKASDSQPSIENHPFEYISLILPQIVYNNPRFTVQTMRTTPIHQMVSGALQQALNKWTEDCALADLLRQLCFDYLTGWGVVMITMEEYVDFKLPYDVSKARGYDTPMWPVVTRLSPDDFFFDPQAIDWHSCRWAGHRRLYDLEDLLSEAEDNPDDGWDAEAIRELRADDRREHADDAPERHQVWVYEVWLPEDREDNSKDEHGKIYTLVEADLTTDPDRQRFIREPRNYYGPPSGPYAMFGAYPVSDEPGFVSPLLATLESQREADEFAQAFSNEAKNYKRQFLTNDKKMAEIMQGAPHGHVFHVDTSLHGTHGPSFAEIQFGGATREQAEGVAQARDRLERMTGMSDAMRGQTGSGTTATEEQIAFQGGNIRVDDLRQRFTRRLVQMAKAVAWYMFTDEEFVIPIGGPEFGGQDVWFEGGANSGLVQLEGLSFHDLELVVEPYSMERITDSARMMRLGQAAERAIAIGQVMPQMPWLNWKEIVHDIGNAYNLPDFSSRFNWEALTAVWSQGGMPMQQGSGAIGQARLQSHTPPGTQTAKVLSPVQTQERPNGRSSGQYAKNGAPQQ